ncbi:MAG: serine/threonine-protein kinase [Acidobacteriota bacterium]
MGRRADWARVEELFFEAEALPKEARSRFLDRSCLDEPDLRLQVERLLAAADLVDGDRDDGAPDGDRIERIVQRAVDARTEADAAEASATAADPIDRVGPFRILELLGEGGMGSVYLAERADGAFDQKVAIKVVKQGLFGRHVERRFERERQILARLEHPAVARLLDGGTTVAGQPYLVMEFVDGEPIDTYCDRHRLPISARLELFRTVCLAVQVAHRNLVVHRDLKPSNILVTADGRPKLLDFGISKLVEGDEEPAGTALTYLGQRVLTPEYASPEQVRGEPITTAVDVYALGLLLHRLLTGDRPYPLPESRGEELRKAICDTPAERPSATTARLATTAPSLAEAAAAARATEPRRLRRRLTGDLDHIVSKALRKEPGERYATVELFAADIGRHLDGLPVEARRGGWRYRAGRFLARHRAGVAAVAAVVVALAVGWFGQVREAERANQEAQRANAEAMATAEVADFLVGLFDAADPTLTREQITARQLLDRGVERIEDELADQPLVQARLMSTLGRVYHNDGAFAAAEPLFAGALELRQRHLPSGHPDIATAHLDLADDLRVQNRLDEAMPHYRQALALRRESFGEESLEVAQVLNNMALGLMRAADYERAADFLQRSIEIRRRHLGEHMLIAQSLHNLTLIGIHRGDYRAAAAAGLEAIEQKRRLLAPDDPSLGRTLFERAYALRKLGDLAAAEGHLVESLELLRKAWDESHVAVLAARGDLAYLRHLVGDQEAAEVEQRAVLELKRQHLGPEHREVAFTLHSLGQQLVDRGDVEKAETVLRRSLELRLRIYPASHPNVASGRHELGSLLLARGRIDDAEPLLREALAVRRQALTPTHPRLADSLLAVADLLLARQDSHAAHPLAEEALSILAAALPTDHPRVAAARAVLAASSGDDKVSASPPA